MRSIKSPKATLCFAALCAMSLAGGAKAALFVPIGVEMSNADSLASTSTAGVISQSNFNLVTVNYNGGTSGTSGALVDGNGNATGVTLTHSSADGFRTGTDTSTTNGTLLHDEDKTGPVGGTASVPGLTATYTFNNVPSGEYNLIAYIENDESVNANITIGATTDYVTDQVASGTPAFLAADNLSASSRVTGNYVEFFNVSPSASTITLTNTAEGGANGTAAINGLQLEQVAVPEPASVAILGLAAAGMLSCRRSRQRCAKQFKGDIHLFENLKGSAVFDLPAVGSR